MLLSEFIKQAQEILAKNGDKEILLTSLNHLTGGVMYDHPKVDVVKSPKTKEVIRYTL